MTCRHWAPMIGALLALTATRAALGASADGVACSAPSDCVSGHCVDGVCCDIDCNGTCETCLAQWKQSGKESGTCGPIRGGTDPENECAAEDRTSCGQTGNCDGLLAACALWPQGTPCHAIIDTECQCDSVVGWICSGTGVCYDQTTPTTCANGDYHCVRSDGQTGSCATAGPGACTSPCSSDSDCNVGLTCLGGACTAKLPVGAACAAGNDCASTTCADGYCCNTACNRQCEACNLPGLEGTCSQVDGEPVAPRQACSGTSPCMGTCKTTRDGCDYPGNAVECSAAMCVDDAIQHAGTCDGTGQCGAGAGEDCGAYRCDAAAGQCFTECTTNAQCKTGATCDTTSGRGTCNPAGTMCEGAWSVRAVDGTVESCNGYACVAGQCQSQCGSAADCAPGFACDTTNRCTIMTDASTGPGTGGAGPEASTAGAGMDDGPTTGTTHDEGGCGCHVVQKHGSGSTLLLVLAVACMRRRHRCTVFLRAELGAACLSGIGSSDRNPVNDGAHD